MSRLLRGCAAAALFTVALTGQALAHAHLKTSAPAAGATVAAPSELDLGFSEGLDLKFSGVAVTGPDKAAVTTGAAKLDPADATKLIVPLDKPLAAGKYTVEWHALSTDGHKSNGSYSFTVKP